MKNTLSILLILFICLFFTACGPEKEISESDSEDTSGSQTSQTAPPADNEPKVDDGNVGDGLDGQHYSVDDDNNVGADRVECPNSVDEDLDGQSYWTDDGESDPEADVKIDDGDIGHELDGANYS